MGHLGAGQARRHARHGGVTEEVWREQFVEGVQVVGGPRLLNPADEVLVVLEAGEDLAAPGLDPVGSGRQLPGDGRPVR